METALSRLEKATNSPAALPEALAAEQAAYQALLKLQQHEYQVMRNRNRSQGGGSSREQQMQRQLDQMDLTQSDNRYETQRQAQRPQNNERREQLQVQNRLQELARRQQDLNDRLKELQTALQERSPVRLAIPSQSLSCGATKIIALWPVQPPSAPALGYRTPRSPHLESRRCRASSA